VPRKAQLTLAPESVFKIGFSTPNLFAMIHFAGGLSIIHSFLELPANPGRGAGN
jgi:hypothetical protein